MYNYVIIGLMFLGASWCTLFIAFGFNLYSVSVFCLSVLAFFLLRADCINKEKAKNNQTETLLRAMEEEKKKTIENAEKTIGQERIKMNKERENFRNKLSHQLRMPLSIIQGYAEILENDMEENIEIRKEYYKKIVNRTQEISKIITLEFSNDRLEDIEVGKFVKDDIVLFLHQYIKDLFVAKRSDDIEIHVLSSEDHYIMDLDKHLLQKALHNIFENAFKYMGRAGNIIVYTQSYEDYIIITVKDDGWGMDELEVENIWKPNYQGGNKKEGTGNGLFIVKRAIEAHNGRVVAKSQFGNGMSIKIALPRFENTPLPKEFRF